MILVSGSVRLRNLESWRAIRQLGPALAVPPRQWKGRPDDTTSPSLISCDGLPTFHTPDTVIPMRRGHRICQLSGTWMDVLRLFKPDIKMIQQILANGEAHRHHVEARTFETLWRAVGDIGKLFEAKGCWSELKAAGYASDQTSGATGKSSGQWQGSSL